LNISLLLVQSILTTDGVNITKYAPLLRGRMKRKIAQENAKEK
jgi:hypothetical protein